MAETALTLKNQIPIIRKETDRYLNILENTFIIKRVYPFYENYKKEIIKTPKVYFMDLGLRNYILNSFNELALRNDLGAIFENFCYLELLNSDFHSLNKVNFWRTTNQTEIDFIVQTEDEIEAIEIKWDKETTPRSFKTIMKYYPQIKCRVLTNKSFLKEH
jgi:predicted AAA+ superfamily ATPase